MQDVIQQIVGRHNRVVNQASPIVDTRLSDGSRVNIVLSPISIEGSAICIRKFPEHPYSMNQLIDMLLQKGKYINWLLAKMKTKCLILVRWMSLKNLSLFCTGIIVRK